MNAKKIITLILLFFVAASIGTIIVKERGEEKQPVSLSEGEALYTPIPPQDAKGALEKAMPVKVVVYYFHGNMRCYSCKLIESFTVEAIDSGFADDLKSGRVELKIVNVEEPSNEHFVQDYGLASRSVVVARYEEGQQKDWKRLDEVWQLTEDKEAFIHLIQEEIKTLLKGQH